MITSFLQKTFRVEELPPRLFSVRDQKREKDERVSERERFFKLKIYLIAYLYLFQLFLESFAALNELPLPGFVLLFDLVKFRLELLLMHREGLNLPLQNLHPRVGDDAPNVRDDCVAEDLVYKAVISEITRICDMFHRVAVVRI